MTDWKDALSSLAAGLPAAPETAAPEGATPEQEAAPATSSPKPPTLDIYYERKGRGGKQATIIAGFPADTPDDTIADLAATIKKRLGCGGSARGGEILIQGDRRRDLQTLLPALGYPKFIMHNAL